MQKEYYIAKIGQMWIQNIYKGIGSIRLTESKNFATHLNLEDAKWVRGKTGANLIIVTVDINEVEVIDHE